MREGPKARTIGVVFLLYFLTAFFASFLTKGLVVPGDAAATANNILAHEALYRSGFAVGLIANVLYIAVTALFYRLFGPVNWSLSAMAAFCSLVGCAIQIFGGLLQLAPFLILRDSQLSNVFTVEQLQAAALLGLKLYNQVFHISFILFGFFMLLLGYLIFRSTFLPRILGVLWMCAGVGALTFVWPPLATALWSYVVLPLDGLAELSLMLWLIVKGVNVSRWQEKGGTAQTGGA
jgi:uncharacterized protein DUF4386